MKTLSVTPATPGIQNNSTSAATNINRNPTTAASVTDYPHNPIPAGQAKTGRLRAIRTFLGEWPKTKKFTQKVFSQNPLKGAAERSPLPPGELMVPSPEGERVLVNFGKNKLDATEFARIHGGGFHTIAENAPTITGQIIGFHGEKARKALNAMPVVGPADKEPSRSAAEYFASNAIVEPRKIPGSDQLPGWLGRRLIIDSRIKIATFNRLPGQLRPNLIGGSKITVFDSKYGVIYADGTKPDKKTINRHNRFREWINDHHAFPCIIAKTLVTGQSSYMTREYDYPIGDPRNAESLRNDLRTFMRYQSEQWRDIQDRGNHFTSFIAFFPNTPTSIEGREEVTSPFTSPEMEEQKKSLEEEDKKTDGMAIEDATNIRREFGLVELRTDALRKSRAHPDPDGPALVFNAADQFGYLQETGQLTALAEAIENRDEAISGSRPNNPGLLNVSLAVPLDVVQDDIDWIQKNMKSLDWSNSRSRRMLFRYLNVYMSRMPDIPSILLKIEKNLKFLESFERYEVIPWVDAHMDKLPLDAQTRWRTRREQRTQNWTFSLDA